MREGISINYSLLVLGNVISALGDELRGQTEVNERTLWGLLVTLEDAPLPGWARQQARMDVLGLFGRTGAWNLFPKHWQAVAGRRGAIRGDTIAGHHSRRDHLHCHDQCLVKG